MDDNLGDVFDLVEGDPVLAGTTLIVLSADHGGTGTGHNDATNAANYTIPFFVWGADVAAGADLYALNAATRAHPVDGRPSYNASPQPIRNGDGGNLALTALGLPPVPGSSINVAAPLALTPPPVCGDGVVDPGEQCDDGGVAAGDCCGATCQYEAAASPCSDGDACTVSTCNGSGVCTGGPPLDCSNGLFCDGLETCDPALGCVGGAPPTTDDGVSCTLDSCDELLDVVVNTASDAPCEDGFACTAGRCDAVLGCVQEPVAECEAGVPALTPRGFAVLLAILLLTGAARSAARSE
jgi:cysteine-rich repeat protein